MGPELERFDTATRKPWAHYLLALVAGALLIIPAFAGFVAVLDYRGSMAPPLLSNNACVDQKLAFMRDNRPSNVNLLVVGSSAAMRHFNTPEAMRIDRALRPYNAGLCAINLWKSEQVINWLTNRLPGVQRVLLVTSSLDYGDCRPAAPPSLDVTEADSFVFGDTWRLGFYLKSFNATTLLRNSMHQRRKQTDRTWFDAVVLNKFGDAPAQPPRDRPEWYVEPKLNDQCFATLRRTARELDARGIQLAVVESPMDPRWRAEFDRSGEVTALMRRKIEDALSGTNAILIEDHNGFSAPNFYDAVHLRASATPGFTRSVISRLEAVDRVGSRAANGSRIAKEPARQGLASSGSEAANSPRAR